MSSLIFDTSPCVIPAAGYAGLRDLMKRFWIALVAVVVIAFAAYAFTVGSSADTAVNTPVDIPNDRVGSGIR